MGALVVLGESAAVAAFALGGATVVVADDDDSVRRAWASVGEDVSVVILTRRADAALGAARARDDVLTVVMPE